MMNNDKKILPAPFYPSLVVVALLVLIMTDTGHAQFTTILNIPPDPDIGDFQSIGSDTQLNLGDGGAIGNGFDAGADDGTSDNVEVNITGGNVGSVFDANTGSVVNILGGSIASGLRANSGSTVNIENGSIGSLDAVDSSTVNITGGSIFGGFGAFDGSTLNISGGAVGDYSRALTGSSVNISGGEFRLDGVLISGLDTVGNSLALDVPDDSVLSGTLADGTPFAVATGPRHFNSGGLDHDEIDNGTLTLTVAVLPAVGPNLQVLPLDPAPRGIRAGQILVVDDSGIVGSNFNAGWGSTVIVAGGQVGNNLEAVGAQVIITSGSISGDFDAFTGTSVTMSGGSIASEFAADTGSTVNITGGLVGSEFTANLGSNVNISGGLIGGFIRVLSGSSLTLGGGEFRLNGSLIAELATPGNSVSLNLDSGTVLSGTLADGTPFALASQIGDVVADGTLTLTSHTLPSVGPSHFSVPTDQAPAGLRSGQTLNLEEGGELNGTFTAGFGSTVNIHGGLASGFDAVGAQVNISDGLITRGLSALGGSVVNISGGTVLDFFGAQINSVVNLSGGSIGSNFVATNGSTVNITGGSIGSHFGAINDSIVNIVDGSIGNSFRARNSSVVNIVGGAIGDSFSVESGSTVNLSGGTVGSRVDVDPGSAVNLFGTQFVLDGFDITGSLTPNVQFTIADRDVTLSGLLADGSQFSFDLNSLDVGSEDFFSSAATLTVTLFDGLLGDYNGNGTVDAADYTVWLDALGSNVIQGTGADGNFNGAIDHADYLVWKSNFGQTAGAGAASAVRVPEPNTSVLLLSAILCTFVFQQTRFQQTRRRRNRSMAWSNGCSFVLRIDDVVRTCSKPHTLKNGYGTRSLAKSHNADAFLRLPGVALAICCFFYLESQNICFAQVNTRNLLENPGAESGHSPWSLDQVGPTLVQTGPLSLSNGVAIVATEGSNWFGGDVIYTSDSGFLSFNTASIRQTIDIRAYENIQSMTVGMDVTGAGETLSGDGIAIVRPTAVVFFLDEGMQHLETQFISFPQTNGQDFEVDNIAIGLQNLSSTVNTTPPSGTAYARVAFTMATGMSSPTTLSDVRVLAGIDDTFFSVAYNPSLPGDYNFDGFVDAADYTVWLDALGSNVIQGTGADGNFNGVIDQADYTVWKQYFGTPVPTDSPVGKAVPEPATGITMILGLAGLLFRRDTASSYTISTNFKQRLSSDN